MKRVKSIIILALILILVPKNVSAKTIAQFEAEVNKYTAELKEKQAKVAKNQAEVEQVKKNIANIQSQITGTENEINSLQEQIEESNKEIIKKSEESKKIMAYYQIENGENAYLEYAFGAETITDMIYRLSITEQLTEYNNQIMQELKQLIIENNKKKESLKAKKEELSTLKKQLEDEKARIELDTKGIVESMPSVEERIKAAKDNLNYYKKLGCGATEDISACQFRVIQSSGNSLPSVGTFQRPISSGKYSRGWTGNYGHRGVDMSNPNNVNIAIHPIAEGEVVAKYNDNCSSSWCNAAAVGAYCHGNANIIVVRHNYSVRNSKFIYSMYVHLSRYGNYNVGDKVTKDSIIGYMGTTGCSTGEHLHLEVTTCHWKAKGGCTYNEFLYSSINPVGTLGINFPRNWSTF